MVFKTTNLTVCSFHKMEHIFLNVYRSKEELEQVVLERFDKDPRAFILDCVKVYDAIPKHLLKSFIEYIRGVLHYHMSAVATVEHLEIALKFASEPSTESTSASETPIVDAMANFLDVLANLKTRPGAVRTREDLVNLIFEELEKDPRRVSIAILNKVGQHKTAKLYASMPDEDLNTVAQAMNETITSAVKSATDKDLTEISVVIGIPPAQSVEDRLREILLKVVPEDRTYLNSLAFAMRTSK